MESLHKATIDDLVVHSLDIVKNQYFQLPRSPDQGVYAGE